MNLLGLQTLCSTLCNDPSNARYLIPDVYLELNNAQRQWNADIKIIKETTTVPIVANQRQYPLTTAVAYNGYPISFPRVTLSGIDLKKRSQSYFDLYTSYDWTQILGTPTDFFIEATDPVNLFLTVYPTPTTNDVPSNLVVEAIVDTVDMASINDTPFSLKSLTIIINYLTVPYHFYLAYDAAARLLARDPSPENQARMASYLKIAMTGHDLLIDVFKQLEASEPLRLQGGRSWGN